MPPKASNTASRKGPAFKPPRPVNAAAQSSVSTNAAKRASGNTAPRVAATTNKKPATARHSFQSTLIPSSESEAEDDEAVPSDQEQSELDDEMEGVDDGESILEPTAPAIPAKLLTRILQEKFEDSDTAIQQGALNLVGKYMETFVREAIARARFERKEARNGMEAGRRGLMDGFLQVEDLERLAPQLVLDF